MIKRISTGLFFTFALMVVSFYSMNASALVVPTSMATDPRIKTIMYGPNEVYKFTGYYRYQSSIEFSVDEEISTISLGDSIPWQLNPVGNRLFIKPVDQDATTNMTVITNKRVYLFELHAEETRNVEDKNLTFTLRFLYPGIDDGSSVTSIDHVPDLEQEDLNKYNFRYTINGSEDIAPIRIFDDGEFTYFEFRDKNGDVPAFYQVDSVGNENILNYRTRGSYIVIERVSPRYTLRHGTSVVCVFNEAMIQNGKGASSKKPAAQK